MEINRLQREIPRYPEAPPLTPRLVALLNQLCFRNNDPEIPEVDALFVFGTEVSPLELLITLSPLLQRKLTNTIIFTGGFVNFEDSVLDTVSIASRMFQAVEQQVPSSMKVILQERSKNTLEDVVFALEMIKIPLQKLCFVSRNFHAGRCLLTLKKYLPHCQFYQNTIREIFPSKKAMITRLYWQEFAKQRSLVWGEYLRIQKYGLRGDIDISSVRDLLLEIKDCTQQ